MGDAMTLGAVVNWSDIAPAQIRPGVRRRIYATDDVLLAHHELDVGIQINPHSHADFEQLVYIAEGECDYYVDGVPHRLSAGSFLLVPRGAEHYVEPLVSPCVNIDIFVPPRADMLPSAVRSAPATRPS